MTKPLQYENRGITARILDQPYLLLLLAPLFWGGNFVAAKMVADEITPFLLIASRCVAATLVIWPFAWRFVRADWQQIKRHWLLLMCYGAGGYALFNVLVYAGAHTTTALNASIEQASLPMLIMAANFALFKVRASWIQIVGVLVALFGVILTATHGNPLRLITLQINQGDGLVMLACLSYTAYTLGLKYRPRVHLMSFMAVAFSGAALASLIMLHFLGGGLGQFATLSDASPKVWGVIIYVAIFPSMFSQIAYARGVELLGANRAAPTHNMIPVFGSLLSVLLLGEHLESYHYLAAMIIIAGIVLAEWAARQRR
jgi:drug/metabolite transporter (DMT)-like permease